jgi:NAD-reducing hydrogenase large subunit
VVQKKSRDLEDREVWGEETRATLLNRVEAVIRCSDPCLSCSTHADGRMALQVQLVAEDGTVVGQLQR